MRAGPLAAALTALGVGVLTAPMLARSPAPRFDGPREGSSRSVWSGLTYLQSSAGGATSELHVGELTSREVKLGLFAMRNVEQVELHDVRVRVVHKPEGIRRATADAPAPAPHLDQLLEQPVRELRLGLVSRATASDVEVTFSDGTQDLLRIAAGRARLGLGAKGLELRDGVWVRSGDGFDLRSNAASWREAAGELRLRGAYQWSRADGRSGQGRDGRFAIDTRGGVRAIP